MQLFQLKSNLLRRKIMPSSFTDMKGSHQREVLQIPSVFRPVKSVLPSAKVADLKISVPRTKPICSGKESTIASKFQKRAAVNQKYNFPERLAQYSVAVGDKTSEICFPAEKAGWIVL